MEGEITPCPCATSELLAPEELLDAALASDSSDRAGPDIRMDPDPVRIRTYRLGGRGDWIRTSDHQTPRPWNPALT